MSAEGDSTCPEAGTPLSRHGLLPAQAPHACPGASLRAGLGQRGGTGPECVRVSARVSTSLRRAGLGPVHTGSPAAGLRTRGPRTRAVPAGSVCRPDAREATEEGTRAGPDSRSSRCTNPLTVRSPGGTATDGSTASTCGAPGPWTYSCSAPSPGLALWHHRAWQGKGGCGFPWSGRRPDHMRSTVNHTRGGRADQPHRAPSLPWS